MADFARLVLDADTRGLKRGKQDLGEFSRQSSKTANDVDMSSGRMAKSFTRLAVAASGAFAAAGGIGSLIRTNADFGQSMQKVAAISGATGSELNKLRQTAKKLGSETQFSASQAADALGFLSMAGFSASESMKAIPSVLSLAAAGALDLASAADIASNVLSGFTLEAEEAGRVSDVLAKAASVSNTSVGQLGQAMSTVAPIASSMKISLEETAAAIGVMSDAGIQGERAGTALRGVLASLAGPTTQAQEALAKYGLTAADVDPQTVGLAEAMERLQKAGLTTADAMTIFGREAASGALVIAQASDRVKDLSAEFLNAEGAADKMAKTMADNLGGDIKALGSALEGLQLSLGDAGAGGAFRTLAQVATTAIRSMTENMNTLISVVSAGAAGFVAYRTTLIATSAASVIMSSRFVTMAATIATVTTQVGALSGAKVALTGILAGTTAAFRTLTAALLANPFTAIAAVVGTLTAAFFALRDSQAAARAETNNLITSLKALAQARSADFASKRAELQTQRNQTFAELERLKSMKGVAAGYAAQSGSMRELQWELVRLDGALKGADISYKRAGAAAKSMNAPVAQTSVSVAKVSETSSAAARSVGKFSAKTSEAERSIKMFDNSLGQLKDRLFPRVAALRTYRQEIELINKAQKSGAFSEGQAGTARSRLSKEFLTDQYGEIEVSVSKGQFDGIDKMLKKAGSGIKDLGKTAGTQTVKIAQSFKDMAESTIASLDRMIEAIKGGGFWDILSSVVSFGLQLGSSGAFGSGVSNFLNSTPARANGGATSAGQTYLVGERGPELWSANQNGFISPNSNTQGMGGNTHVTVGIDPRNGNVTAYVDNRISSAAPTIVQASTRNANSQAARQQSRRVR